VGVYAVAAAAHAWVEVPLTRVLAPPEPPAGMAAPQAAAA
jgi:hypothetical protein